MPRDSVEAVRGLVFQIPDVRVESGFSVMAVSTGLRRTGETAVNSIGRSYIGSSQPRFAAAVVHRVER